MRFLYYLLSILGAIAGVAAGAPPGPTEPAKYARELNVSADMSINCKGSAWCYGNTAKDLVSLIDSIPDGVYYSNGQQIGE